MSNQTEQLAVLDFAPIGRGTTFEALQFTIDESLTGGRVRLYLRKPGEAQPRYKFDSDPAINTISIDSEFQFTLKAFTVNLPVGVYEHDLIITAGGNTLKWATGKFTVEDTISL